MNLIKHQRPDIDKIYLYVKDPFESKYKLLVNGREKVEIRKLKNPKAFTDYSQTIHDIYEDLEDYNVTKKRRVLIVYDNMITKPDKKLSSTVSDLFLRGRKLNILLVFISQFYLNMLKTIRLNATHHFVMKNTLFCIGFKDLMKLYKD